MKVALSDITPFDIGYQSGLDRRRNALRAQIGIFEPEKWDAFCLFLGPAARGDNIGGRPFIVPATAYGQAYTPPDFNGASGPVALLRYQTECLQFDHCRSGIRISRLPT